MITITDLGKSYGARTLCEGVSLKLVQIFSIRSTLTQ